MYDVLQSCTTKIWLDSQWFYSISFIFQISPRVGSERNPWRHARAPGHDSSNTETTWSALQKKSRGQSHFNDDLITFPCSSGRLFCDGCSFIAPLRKTLVWKGLPHQTRWRFCRCTTMLHQCDKAKTIPWEMTHRRNILASISCVLLLR